MQGWIGVDLDGTLAEYDARRGLEHVGKIVPGMHRRVQEWLSAGREVRIFTARGSDPALRMLVKPWLREHNLPDLEVTNLKDSHLLQIWDDRAVQIEVNTGRIITPRQYVQLVPKGWIGIELDGTLAESTSPQSLSSIGAPVSNMINLVRQWVMVDMDVRIFTARATLPGQIELIHAWLGEQGIKPLLVTNQKDFQMIQFFDCNAVHVVPNEGRPSSADEPALAERYAP
jgi:hypothetical protein